MQKAKRSVGIFKGTKGASFPLEVERKGGMIEEIPRRKKGGEGRRRTEAAIWKQGTGWRGEKNNDNNNTYYYSRPTSWPEANKKIWRAGSRGAMSIGRPAWPHPVLN